VLKIIAWLPLKVAESRMGGRAAAWAARHVPRLLPVRRATLTETTFAMLHPLPQYPDHVVITPRTYIADLCALVQYGHAEALRDTLDLARELDRTRSPGGRLFTISNGARLHVQHVHGHLVARSDAFWLDDDEHFEVARPRRDDPAAVLQAVGDALGRVGGCQTEGSLIFEDLQAEHLRISVTIAPPQSAS
jgi:diadenosine tetraphosphate (Ap4A) HIT family hydrolase